MPELEVIEQRSLLPGLVPGLVRAPPRGRRRRYSERSVLAKVLMLGGGLQSSILAEMVAAGELERPDLVLFNDTGDEPAWVYQQLGHLRRRLAGVNVPLEIHAADCWGLLSSIQRDSDVRGSMPVWVKNPDGSVARLRRQCTHEFKVRPGNRAIKLWLVRTGQLRLPPPLRYERNPVTHAWEMWDRASRVYDADDFQLPRMPARIAVETWFGYSTDEAIRARRKKPIGWQQARYPLLELGLSRSDCVRWYQARGLPVPLKSACVQCFAGETEVITRQGVRPIRELVGTAELLVPIANGHYRDGAHGWRRLQPAGKWEKVEVRSFGRQALMQVTLRRGKATKVVRATAGHRWVLADTYAFVTTRDLRRGQHLAACRAVALASSGSPVKPSSFGVARGFVFGDGSRGSDNRPAYVSLHAAKDKALLPYFGASDLKVLAYVYKGRRVEYPRVRDLPRFWKDLPPLKESRSFLLGWLAGYFAADGTVSPNGRQATLASANVEHLRFVREVCYVLGVETSEVRGKWHPAAGGKSWQLFTVSLRIGDLPESFWILDHHRERVERSNVAYRQKYLDWAVECVESTNDVEEVYCAEVPGVEMFTLADNLLVGNCPFRDDEAWQWMKAEQPGEFERACAADDLLRSDRVRRGHSPYARIRGEMYLHQSCQPLRQVDFVARIAARRARYSMFEIELVDTSCRSDGGFSCMS